MPVYRFISSGEQPPTAPVIVELEDDRKAWHEAVVALGEQLQEIDGHLGQETELVASVEDEAGQKLFEIRCTTNRCR
jgi:hypothetical protein